MKWTSNEVRKTFLAYFSTKSHSIVDSAPMVIKDDPTLMFTNAGMNQFKEYFLGNKQSSVLRIADSQKCLRVSGKHNDLEEVGVDTYHHTMFEMLGNWSFGDYFKREAIEWAWDILVNTFGIDKDRIYVTVFEGNEEDGLDKDMDAYNEWTKWIAEERILNGSKKDNFWEMGATGPCGPCSELHVDVRPDTERKLLDGKSLVNEDHPQVIEIWNLVFMEFNRLANGSLKPLPQKHVDTGMGFERLVRVLQEKSSNYDTDLFMPIIGKLEIVSGINYGEKETQDIAFRVIADHIRAVSFSIADGQLPSNTGAGYVIRRILRRAIRYGYSNLNIKEPFMHVLFDELNAKLGDQFKELGKQSELIQRVIKEEEESFLRTLAKGINRFNDYVQKLDANADVDGKFAFELFDTFGFPIDLTQLMAGEKGLSVDMEGFEIHLQEQKNRSREATAISTDDWVVLLEGEQEKFVGYDATQVEARITRYRKTEMKGKLFYQLVLDVSPFYPEGGGQVGDTGVLSQGETKITIFNTKKENNLILHFSKELPKTLDGIFIAKVNTNKRVLTAANHTATHLLHEALREVLGDHVEQKGSLVNADYLRFDFSHFSKVEKSELAIIESKVNAKIRKSYALEEYRSMPIEEAKALGAMALFGEKYGENVRVIKFDSSVELCGGIHVKNTSAIGQFKLISEGAVAAGIRRVEALSSLKADEYVQDLLFELAEIKSLLKHPKDVIEVIKQQQKQLSDIGKQVERLNKEKAISLKGELLGKIELINGVNYLAEEVNLDPGSIKDLAFQLREQVDNLFMVLGTANGSKANITVVISEELSNTKDLHAGNIVRELAKEIKGGGGGQPLFATAGGNDASGISIALDKARAYLG